MRAIKTRTIMMMVMMMMMMVITTLIYGEITRQWSGVGATTIIIILKYKSKWFAFVTCFDILK